MSTYQRVSDVMFEVWGGSAVIYNIMSGNTFLIEKFPIYILEYCLLNDFIDIKELVLSPDSEDEIIDSQYIDDILNSFIKMGFLEEIE